MTLQTVRELLTQRPFQPFRVAMSDGEAYDVLRPESAFLTRSDLVIGLDHGADGVPARFRICSLLHVTEIEPLSSSAGPSQSGAG